MMRKRGIVRKTFLFSSLLIVLVITLSFSVLYFVMPGYYLTKKQQSLQKNLDNTSQKLITAETVEECAEIISAFVKNDNVTVFSFGTDDEELPEISSPIVNMQGERAWYRVAIRDSAETDSGEKTDTIFVQRVNPVTGGNGVELAKALPGGDFPPEYNGGHAAGVKIRGFAAKPGDVISLRQDINNGIISYIMVGTTLQPIDEAKDVMLSLIPYVLAVGIVLALVFAWVYARQLSKPILRLSDAAVRMQKLEPGAVSGLRSNDELGQLSEDIDEMYAHLRENIEELRDERDKVGRLERVKTEMMQSASHELKTPIAALSGMLDGMIDNIGVYSDKEKYLLRCKTQVERLSMLVAEILSASRSDVPDDATEYTDTEVHLLAERVLDEYSVPLGKNRLHLTKSISNAVIHTDPGRLYRVISNLMSNAVRYTPQSGTIRVAVDDSSLVMENDCPPVSEEELSKWFDPFYTGSQSRDKSHSGTGLGLYIVKQNLERLGIPYDVSHTGGKLTIMLHIVRRGDSKSHAGGNI